MSREESAGIEDAVELCSEGTCESAESYSESAELAVRLEVMIATLTTLGAAWIAVALGAIWVEKHFTLSRDLP